MQFIFWWLSVLKTKRLIEITVLVCHELLKVHEQTISQFNLLPNICFLIYYTVFLPSVQLIEWIRSRKLTFHIFTFNSLSLLITIIISVNFRDHIADLQIVHHIKSRVLTLYLLILLKRLNGFEISLIILSILLSTQFLRKLVVKISIFGRSLLSLEVRIGLHFFSHDIGSIFLSWNEAFFITLIKGALAAIITVIDSARFAFTIVGTESFFLNYLLLQTRPFFIWPLVWRRNLFIIWAFVRFEFRVERCLFFLLREVFGMLRGCIILLNLGK